MSRPISNFANNKSSMDWIINTLSENNFYENTLVFIFIFAIFAFIGGFIRPGQYGRFALESETRFKIPTRLAWIIMEAPACLVFAWFFFTGTNELTVVSWTLFVLWQSHYFHRTFIYPFQIKVKQGGKTPIKIPFIGSFYCGLNGYVNGYWIGSLGNYSNEWLSTPQFIIGLVVFIIGFVLNKHSDFILRNLRAPNETGYKIPRGGAYKFVSSPNYLGEILTWAGFALATWSLPALSFLVFTIANLVPRAISNHRWYQEKFPEEYPKNRKAIIPYIL